VLYTSVSGYIFLLTNCCLFSFIVEESNSKLTAKLAELFDEGEKGSGVEPGPGPLEEEELKALHEIVDAVRLTR